MVVKDTTRKKTGKAIIKFEDKINLTFPRNCRGELSMKIAGEEHKFQLTKPAIGLDNRELPTYRNRKSLSLVADDNPEQSLVLNRLGGRKTKFYDCIRLFTGADSYLNKVLIKGTPSDPFHSRNRSTKTFRSDKLILIPNSLCRNQYVQMPLAIRR